jgi:hypothetical protein
LRPDGLFRRDPPPRLRYVREEQIRIQADKVRIDNLTLGQALIIRLDRKQVIQLNLLRKTASEQTFDQFAARRSVAIEGVRRARDRVRDTPEAVRLDGILREFGIFAGAPPGVIRRPVGEKAVIAGREAARVRIEVGGEARLDLWLTEGFPEAKVYVDALAAFQAVPPDVAEALRQGPGLPLREDSRYAWFLDRIHVRAETKTVETDPIPAAEFEVPAGYKPAPSAPIPEEEGEEMVLPAPASTKK